MPIGDWIRESTEKRRRRIHAQGYRRGYEDAIQGKPPEVPPSGPANQPRPEEPDSAN